MSNPIVGLIMGAIFGASLVLAGLADPDKIIGTLRLKDFHALRTVVVFVLVGMLGTWILASAGAANFDIKPAAILTVAIGGAFLGMGLGLTGFSPGTALASAASGRMDALFTIAGMLFGAHVYILIYPYIVVPLEKIVNWGSITLPQITGFSTALWVIPIFATGSLVLFLRQPGKMRLFGLRRKEGDLMMDGNYVSIEGVRFTPDCLEAAQVFRGWKNILFIIIVLCLLVHQTAVWLTITGKIEIGEDVVSKVPVFLGRGGNQAAVVVEQATTQSNISATAAQAPVIEPQKSGILPFDVTFVHVTSVLRLANAILLLSSLLYAMTLFLSLITSLFGGMTGLRHISRAFYFALVMFILLLPWQIIFGPIALGAIYTPNELVRWCTADISGTFDIVLFYLRFTGYWALVTLILLLAQSRSHRWTQSMLRGLKIVEQDFQKRIVA